MVREVLGLDEWVIVGEAAGKRCVCYFNQFEKLILEGVKVDRSEVLQFLFFLI